MGTITMERKTIKEIAEYAINGLENLLGSEPNTSDLHNELFNTDYFIIGYYQAEQWLIENPGIFAAIEEIKDYEQDNFGEVTTDLSSSEKVVNMYAYIKGEEVLGMSKTYIAEFDGRLNDKGIKQIIKELKSLY